MRWKREHIATGIAVLFHVTGALGILFTKYRDWFISLTPFTLCLMAVLLAWCQREKPVAFVLFFVLAFATGTAMEVIGVNTGKLFGDYHYGTVLGPAWHGVPLLIGLNWFVVVFSSGSLMMSVQQYIERRAEGTPASLPKYVVTISFLVDGALLAVFFDWMMEPAAMRYGFWQWDGNTIPFYNYACWWIISLLLLAVMRSFSFRRPNYFAVHLFIIQLLFFLAIR